MMMKSNTLPQVSVFASTLLIGIAMIWGVGFQKATLASDSARPMLIPPENAKYFALGYNEIVADLIWLRTIQDFDYCETRPTGVYDPSKFKCAEGWVYHMIDSTTELAPKFRQPYISGALMLSVIVNDIKGSSKIFDKAVERYPTDWQILYNASYHAMREEKDLIKAADLLTKAGANGAPQWVFSLAARLHEKSGQLEIARSIMTRAAEAASTETEAAYFTKRLAEIDKQIAEEQAKQKH